MASTSDDGGVVLLACPGVATISLTVQTEGEARNPENEFCSSNHVEFLLAIDLMLGCQSLLLWSYATIRFPQLGCPLRSARQPPDFSGPNGLMIIGAVERGETKGEGPEIIPSRVQWLTVFFDRTKQFAHRALEAILKPGSFQV